VINLITPCALFSPVLLQSCSVIHETGSDNSFHRYGHSKVSKMAGGRILDLVQPEVGPFDLPSPKTIPTIKHEVDRTIHCRDIAFEIFKDGGQPPSWIWSNRKYRHMIRRPQQPYPKTKHEVDRTTHCRDMAVQNFPKCESRSVVGPQYIPCSYVLLFATLGT